MPVRVSHLPGVVATWVPIWVAVWSLVAFAVMLWDKARARRAARRVPERSLMALAAMGGGVGSLLAAYLIRHKTRHVGLMVAFWIGTLLWLGLLAWAWGPHGGILGGGSGRG